MWLVRLEESQENVMFWGKKSFKEEVKYLRSHKDFDKSGFCAKVGQKSAWDELREDSQKKK